jgi:hypothetical protein
MTADQWEAWVERAAIMEYDGGLDRQTATIQAFKECSAADYADMLRKDTDTAIFASIEAHTTTQNDSLSRLKD